MTDLVQAIVANSRTVIVPHPTRTRSTTMLVPDPTGRTDGTMTTRAVPLQVEHGPGAEVEVSADDAAMLRAAGFLLPAGEVYRERVAPPMPNLRM